MKKLLLFTAVLLSLPTATVADPLHEREGGDYWHHDSGWIFPARIGEFQRVGSPQDVAGSRDAVAYYAWEMQGQRIVASVDVIAADSASELASEELEVASTAAALPWAPVDVKAARTVVPASTPQTTRLRYLVIDGEWRVRIQVELPAANIEASQLDEFARLQRWDTLP